MSETKQLDEPLAPMPAPPQDDVDQLIGQKLGDFTVEAAIAAGGMGIVYRAVHPLIGRKVAVKVLRPEVASDVEQTDRFLKEAQALSAIKHRGIIDIIGFGNLTDGRQYMMMEFLEGQSLEQVIEKEAPMAPARVLALMDEVLNALSAAHKVGVVHRDLKPSNVFIAVQSNGEKNVKLLDFGLAKHAPVTLEQVNDGALDKSSVMAGTPEYIAPEQARGLAPSPVTDVYSLGVVAFEMASGRLPFKADGVVEMLTKHVREAPPRLSSVVNGISPEFDDLIDQMLKKKPEERPASAELCRQTVQRISRALRDQATVVRANPLLSESEQVGAPAAALTPAPMAATLPPGAVVTAPVPMVPSIPIAAVKPDRKPAIAFFALIAVAILVWLLWPRGEPVVNPPAVATGQPPVTPTVEVKAPEVKPAPVPPPEVKTAELTAPQVAPVAEVKPPPAGNEPDLLAPLKTPEKGKGVAAAVSPKNRVQVTVNDTNKQVLVVENDTCVPDADWREFQKRNLTEGEMQIKERLAESGDTDGVLKLRAALSAFRKDVDNAKSATQCSAVSARIEAFIKAQTRKK